MADIRSLGGNVCDGLCVESGWEEDMRGRDDTCD